LQTNTPASKKMKNETGEAVKWIGNFYSLLKLKQSYYFNNNFSIRKSTVQIGSISSFKKE
jgi:hypothetical protein